MNFYDPDPFLSQDTSTSSNNMGFYQPVQYSPHQQGSSDDVLSKIPRNFKCSALCNPNSRQILQSSSSKPSTETTVPPFWCQIYFYQFDQRVDSFKGYGTEVTIDGLCAPSDLSRFCLGIKGSIVSNPVVETARRQIGDGCRLYMDGHDVHIVCLSDSPIFVQCPSYAAASGDNLATVYRLVKGHNLCVFNNKKFTELLQTHKRKPYASLLSLQSMCHLRISFVKGWGEYYRRQTIMTTPCWVEVFLAAPLERLDCFITESVEWNSIEPLHRTSFVPRTLRPHRQSSLS